MFSMHFVFVLHWSSAMRPLESQDPFGPLCSATLAEHFEQDPRFPSCLRRFLNIVFQNALRVPEVA